MVLNRVVMHIQSTRVEAVTTTTFAASSILSFLFVAQPEKSLRKFHLDSSALNSCPFCQSFAPSMTPSSHNSLCS